MKRGSATVQLALLVFACQIVAAAVLLGGIGGYIRWQSAIDVRTRSEELREDLLAVYGRDGAAALARVVSTRSHRHAGGAVVLLTDRAYRPVAGNLAAWPDGLGSGPGLADRTLTRIGDTAPEPMRLRATRLPDGTHLLTGMILRGEQRAIAVVEEASLAALALAILLAAAAAWASARMFAARLAEPVAALEAARYGDLSRRVADTAGGDSFAALARVVNATLERLQALVGDLTFATDAMAHDLKSPLTRLSAALDRAALAHDTDAMAQGIARAQDEATRILAIVTTALSIRRAESGVGRDAFTPVDVAAMLEDLAEIYGPVAEDAGREIVADAPGPLILTAHRELLGQAIGNLIDNALKYGEGRITLSARRDAIGVTLTVRDEGPGIRPEDRAAALQRFGRLDTARTREGAGLGFSLIAAVASLHEGELDLQDAAPGLAASLILPI
ncbi:sensor histidine kinase [Sphingomonas floccifaciens]|uniref:histidine kinase n=1 Tax=Sphingomonas floccifaciens TaxID=1844115 RepID=A0ABW4N7K9_9SPHN